MGYLSCNAESAIATCDSYNWELLTNKHRKDKRPAKITEYSFSDLNDATDGFCDENLLGKGSHGFVYRAQFNRISLVAAVKRTKQTHPVIATASPADNEVEILSKIYHPRLVNLLGFAVDPDHRKLIVVEHMPNGSLYDLLHRSSEPPGWVTRALFAVQVARALQFLHSSNPPIIHRDIKSSNVLIDSKFKCRISDFGLALRGHVEDVKVRSTPPAGTLGYLDPGYLGPEDLSTKSDVFSFGILLLEIISGRNAIDVNYSPPSVVEWAVPRIKSGHIEEICDPRIGHPEDDESIRLMALLAARCVRSTAAKRPGMAEVLARLKDAYKSMRMPSHRCATFGRRVVRVVRDCHVVSKYEPLDESIDVVVNRTKFGSKRNGKISSAPSAELKSHAVVDLDHVGRSKSMGTGTAREIRFGPLDMSSGVELTVKMAKVTLGKSRSMGILQSKRLANHMEVVGSRKLEESCLLVDGEIFKSHV